VNPGDKCSIIIIIIIIIIIMTALLSIFIYVNIRPLQAAADR